MKKVIIAFLALTTCYAISAQETKVVTTTSSGTYNAYSIPEPIRVQYEIEYGDPTIATWYPMNDMWIATTRSNTNNRITHVYYGTEPWYMVEVPDRTPVGFTVTLPVINTYVPEEVITTAINKYGNSIYSITQLKTQGNAESYQVGLIENGVLRTVLMDNDGMDRLNNE